VYADTPEQLIERLDTIFTRLRAHGLKAKASKCVLFKASIDFLGHTVSAEGIEPQTEKIAAIRDWPTPQCLRDVRAFFGLASYYRRFVKDFATIAEPLSRITRKGIVFHGTDETQLRYDTIEEINVDSKAEYTA